MSFPQFLPVLRGSNAFACWGVSGMVTRLCPHGSFNTDSGVGSVSIAVK